MVRHHSSHLYGRTLVAPMYGKYLRRPMVFLAGPIQCAPRWQDDAVSILHRFAPEIHIANPRRDDASYGHGDFSAQLYAEQVDWETWHLRRSARNGGIIFYLTSELEHRCDRAYAQTTRFEIGEWKERCMRDGTLLVIGIENGFTGAKYIRRRFAQDCPRVPVCESLEETCSEMVRLLRQ